MIDRILQALEKKSGIDDWRLIQCQSTHYQLYVIEDIVDNIRKVNTSKIYLTIYSDHDGLRGSTTVTLPGEHTSDVNKQIEQAVYIARRVGNPMYSLPSPSEIPFVESFDPTLLGDVEDVLFVQLADRLIESVESEKEISLSSSEYFLDLQNYHVLNSRGLDTSFRKSEIFFDGVLIAGKGEDEIEIHFEPRARRLQDLPIETIIHKYSGFGRDSMAAGLPKSGSYPVVLTGEALSAVFSPLVYHTSASSLYRKTSQFQKGSSIFQKPDLSGEPLTLISNAYIPFGLKTSPVDIDGVPAGRTELVREGVFVKPWSTQQFADYLKVPATGDIANLEIPIGPNSCRKLTEDDGPVLEIVEFAAMMPDPVSGNFASEIRVAYEHYQGRSRPVRGGSLSGNFLNAFQNARFSTESQMIRYALSLENFGTYLGPRSIRFNTLQVSGD